METGSWEFQDRRDKINYSFFFNSGINFSSLKIDNNKASDLKR